MAKVEKITNLKIVNDGNGGCCANLDNTKSNILKVLSAIQQYQEKVRKHIDENYVDYLPNNTSADLYLDEANNLLKETEHILNNLQNDASAAISDANSELASYYDQLQELSLGLRVTNRILKIDDLFQQIEDSSSKKDYIIVLDLLCKLKNLICKESNDPVDRVFQRCQCYDTINVKYQIQTNILKQNLQQCFEHLVQLSEKQFAHTKAVTILVSKDVTQLQDTAMALFQARYNPIKMCNFLYENCFEPLILKPVSLEYIEENEFERLTLSYSLKSLNNSLTPSYKQVFENLRTLLNCFKNINVSFRADQYVFTIIGDHIKERFFKTLIDECLMNAIPETMDELQECTLVEDVIEFEHLLADTFLINIEKDHALTEFAESFTTNFHNRFSKNILETSIGIMKKDLQDMTLIAEKNTPEEVAKNPFLFPSCMISKSVLELVKLMERILRQQSSENNEANNSVDKFTSIIPAILQNYVSEVPIIHEKLLKSIPQQSALFHTNCMFLAHWVATNEKSIETTPALMKTLQATSNKYLNMQIASQQKIIMDILKEFDLSDIRTMGTGPMKLIRQCLRQLDLLKNVWQNVLPDNTYNKTFFEMLNNFITDIIRRILALEDISATLATELSDLITVILERTPTLFKEKHEVIHIKNWMKLQQLKIILNGSLSDITEQWCEGAGILTANYKPDEIKHLIRALFQNTDRRAKALAKIV